METKPDLTLRGAVPAREDLRPTPTVEGASLFARYAYPPNELGYCGPPDHRALLEYGAAGVVDPGLVQLARGFDGAWPYLELIAGEAGIADPLDRRVVEAYWVGNALLDQIDMSRFGNSLTDRFRKRAGSSFGFLAEHVPAGAAPHHSFHVFGVYPWVGLLGSDRGETPLFVLDRCRIRWGTIVSLQADTAIVRSKPLTWDGHSLTLGAPQLETVTRAVSGVAFLPDLKAGDQVSLHWGWICDRLSTSQLRNLRAYTARQLVITNREVAHSGPAAALK